MQGIIFYLKKTLSYDDIMVVKCNDDNVYKRYKKHYINSHKKNGV